MDSVAHLLKYPRDGLPTLHDICEMICGVRDAYPEWGCLDGATVDVRTAYNQYTVLPSEAKLLATFFTTSSRPDEQLVAIPVTGVFGERFRGKG